jgi:hypothetical protein
MLHPRTVFHFPPLSRTEPGLERAGKKLAKSGIRPKLPADSAADASGQNHLNDINAKE